jgi:hypothetical protein
MISTVHCTAVFCKTVCKLYRKITVHYPQRKPYVSGKTLFKDASNIWFLGKNNLDSFMAPVFCPEQAPEQKLSGKRKSCSR